MINQAAYDAINHDLDTLKEEPSVWVFTHARGDVSSVAHRHRHQPDRRPQCSHLQGYGVRPRPHQAIPRIHGGLRPFPRVHHLHGASAKTMTLIYNVSTPFQRIWYGWPPGLTFEVKRISYRPNLSKSPTLTR